MRVATEDLQSHWATLGPMLVIRSEDDYERAVEHLNQLLDYVGTNEQHPLYGLLDTLGTLIHAYEEDHHSIPESSGADVLRFLMEEHALTEFDLSEIGSAQVVSAILNGDRELTAREIRMLAQRFHVSPSVFI